jgi:hypothetical protein
MRGMDDMAVNKAVASLAAVGWLEPVGRGPVYKKWVVPQSVFDQMAERTEIERKRLKTLGKLMNARYSK